MRVCASKTPYDYNILNYADVPDRGTVLIETKSRNRRRRPIEARIRGWRVARDERLSKREREIERNSTRFNIKLIDIDVYCRGVRWL